MIAELVQSGPGGWLAFLLILVVAAVVIITTLAPDGDIHKLQLPSREDIRYKPHAEEKHGEDAIRAREAVQNCSPFNLRVKYCPKTETRGARVLFWCNSGGSLCGGTITTIGGTEATSFVKPCDAWNCNSN